MRIAVIASSYEDSESVFKDHDDYECTPAPYFPEHTWESIGVPKANAVSFVRELVWSKKYDMFINLCDGAWDEDRAGVEVVEALEHYRAPYTGGAPAFYNLDKQRMKILAQQGGVRTAPFAFCYAGDDLESSVSNLKYPLIVKHYNSGGSIGTTRESCVSNFTELQQEVARFMEMFGGVLVEEFIEGREFTVLVSEGDADGAEPIAYVPIECSFPDGETFKHFDMKWVNYEGIGWAPVQDAALSERLRDVSRRAFTAVGGNSYGRCDLRMNSKGDIYFLEINPNCGLYYPRALWGSADFILDNDPAGVRGFTERIMRCAMRRFEQTKVRFQVRTRKDGKLSCFASCDIPANSVLIRGEAAPHLLASSAYLDAKPAPVAPIAVGSAVTVLRQYDGLNRTYFRAASASEPANARYNGLDIVATQPIMRAEEIFVDVATFGQHL